MSKVLSIDVLCVIQKKRGETYHGARIHDLGNVSAILGRFFRKMHDDGVLTLRHFLEAIDSAETRNAEWNTLRRLSDSYNYHGCYATYLCGE